MWGAKKTFFKRVGKAIMPLRAFRYGFLNPGGRILMTFLPAGLFYAPSRCPDY